VFENVVGNFCMQKSRTPQTCQGAKGSWISSLDFSHLKRDQIFWTAVQCSSVSVGDQDKHSWREGSRVQ